ncbi:MAG: bifunctional nuclease family protein [Bacillota bacterium]
MIPVKVREVVLDQVQNPLLLLVDMDETMVLPIGIGFWEAQAIVLKLQGHVPPRPMTHDLIKSLCGHLGATVEKIVVTDIKDSTFFAEIYLQTGGRELVVDARPSDAVALALTVGSPIYITGKVAAYTILLEELAEEPEPESLEHEDTGDSGPHLH